MPKPKAISSKHHRRIIGLQIVIDEVIKNSGVRKDKHKEDEKLQIEAQEAGIIHEFVP